MTDSTHCRTLRVNSVGGFTLIELIMVILLLALLGGLAAMRVESVGMWQKKEDLRTFAALWETMYNEAVATRYGFQLVIDLDNQTYHGLQELPSRTNTTIVLVDHLKNFRTKQEKERRDDKNSDDSKKEFEEEVASLDEYESGDLEVQFFDAMYADPFQEKRTVAPIDFPSLAEPRSLSSGIRIVDVKVANETFTEGNAIIRFTPNGAVTFAVVHFEVEEQEAFFTLIMNPSTGKVRSISGNVDYEWKLPSKTIS